MIETAAGSASSYELFLPPEQSSVRSYFFRTSDETLVRVDADRTTYHYRIAWLASQIAPEPPPPSLPFGPMAILGMDFAAQNQAAAAEIAAQPETDFGYHTPEQVLAYRIEKIRDVFGNTTRFHYEDESYRGRLSSVEDTQGRFTTLQYVQSGVNGGRLEDVIDPFGRRIHFEYDVNGDLLEVTQLAQTNVARTIRYTYYDGSGSWGDEHFLHTVEAPREVALGGSPKPFVRNRFINGRLTYQEYGEEAVTPAMIPDAGCTEPAFSLNWLEDSGTSFVGTFDHLVADSKSSHPNIISEIQLTDRTGYLTRFQLNAAGQTTAMILTGQGGEYRSTYEYSQGLQVKYGHPRVLGSAHLTEKSKYYDSLDPLERGELRSRALVDENGVGEKRTTYDNFHPSLNIPQNEELPNGVKFERVVAEVNLPGGTVGIRVTVKKFAAGNTTLHSSSSYLTDQYGRVIEKIDAVGTKTEFAYLGLAKLVATKTVAVGQPEQYTETYAYDARGNMTSATNARGYTTSYVFDLYDKVIETDYADGSGVKRYYDDNGSQVSITQPVSSVRWLTLTDTKDILGQTIQQDAIGMDGTTRTERWEYDASERLVKHLPVGSSPVTYVYDSAHVLCQVIIDANGTSPATTSYIYDDQLRRATVTNALGHITSFDYNKFGELSETISPLGNRQTISSGVHGPVDVKNFSATGDLLTHTWTEYNSLGQVTASHIRHQDSSGVPVGDGWDTTEYLEYNLHEKPVRIRDDNGAEKTAEYDRLGRLWKAVDPGGITTEIDFAPGMNLPLVVTVTSVDVNDPNVSVTRVSTSTYNEVDKEISAMGPGGDIKTRAYDFQRRAYKTIETDGVIHETIYNDFGEPIGDKIFEQDGTTLIKEIQMQVDAFGRRTHVIDATGRVSTYEYDSWGRVWREHYPDGGMLEREFSLINQVVRVVKANGVESTMQYDDEGRPERVSYPVVPAGILGDSADVLYNYDGYGRITSVSDGDSTISYEYDSLGNVIKETNGVGFHAPVRDTTYGYDSLSRLSSANYPTLPGHPAVNLVEGNSAIYRHAL